MAEDSDLEKTEPASSRRIEQAREEGNVPQSRELTAFMVLAAGTGTLWVMGSWISQRTTSLLSSGLSFDRRAAFDPEQMAILVFTQASESRPELDSFQATQYFRMLLTH